MCCVYAKRQQGGHSQSSTAVSTRPASAVQARDAQQPSRHQKVHSVSFSASFSNRGHLQYHNSLPQLANFTHICKAPSQSTHCRPPRPPPWPAACTCNITISAPASPLHTQLQTYTIPFTHCRSPHPPPSPAGKHPPCQPQCPYNVHTPFQQNSLSFSASSSMASRRYSVRAKRSHSVSPSSRSCKRRTRAWRWKSSILCIQ